MFMLKTMKQELMADTRSKIGAALAKPALRRLKHTLDYTEVGGAPLLGVQGAVVKAHGSSNAHAFSCAIDQAIKMVNGHVVEIIEKGVAKMNSQDAQCPQSSAAKRCYLSYPHFERRKHYVYV